MSVDLAPEFQRTPDRTVYRDLNGIMDPYENPGLPIAERVEDLLGRLSLEEKAGLMFHTMVSAAESGKLGDETPRAGRAAERARILAVLNSREFVGLAPMQFYTKLLDQGIYLGSLSTFYRPLEENNQLKERIRLAKHSPRAVPELLATAPGQVFTCCADVVSVLDQTFRAGQGKVLRLLHDGGYPLQIHRRRPRQRHRIRGAGGRDDEGNLRDPRHPPGHARGPGERPKPSPRCSRIWRSSGRTPGPGCPMIIRTVSRCSRL